MKKQFAKILVGVGAAVLLLTASKLPAAAERKGEKVDMDLKPLRDAVCEVWGDDTIVGCAVTGDEISLNDIQDLVEHHFNAVTLGNELKPDALFGYSNDKCPGTVEVEFNGETFVAPRMDYSRAEKILNIIYDWNQENPDRIIKVRGHVLVWHSQTPEWFFHENYDPKADYVSKEEMSKRLEWYIKTVLEHFAGPESKYAGMFYGWDVVNEAISDGGGYRKDNENPNESLGKSTHGSNSSWWHVYGSEEYIVEAFRFANKYAPKEIDLYYNDYNETVFNKITAICTLLETVKNAEGTRIDGMGMQGHYSAQEMMQDKVEVAAKNYINYVDKLMITEWDLKASDSYDRSEESYVEEVTKQALRYNLVYDRMYKLKTEDNINFVGFVFWGTIDKFSWLQSRNDVGGASKGGAQCPLLFGDECEAKPAYWAFVDKTKMTDYKKAYQESKKAEEEAVEEVEEEPSDVTVEQAKEEESKETELSAPEENKDSKDKEKKSNIATFSLIIIIAFAIGILSFLNVRKITGGKNKKK